ncbi:MAG: transposase, partial [Bacteroidetes bacterium]|nr:transposase [Bacteroidota bacterium]
MVATIFIDQQYPVGKVLKYVGLSPSSYYKQHKDVACKKRGLSPSEYTKKQNGTNVNNAIVVEQIKSLLSTEFVDYGYLKVTHYLRDTFHYIINHKKVYRLMRVNNLLYQPTSIKVGNKQWVSK